MKHAKLVEIQKKAHKHDVVGGIAASVAVLMLCSCVFSFGRKWLVLLC